MTRTAAVLLGVAIALICAGVAMIAVSAGLIVAGVLIGGVGILMLEVRNTDGAVRRVRR